MIDETRNAAPGMLCHIAEWNGVDGGSRGKGVGDRRGHDSCPQLRLDIPT